ncbi:CAP domain-containing protein [Mesorhizobium sp. 1B3]|uniref:CAP domain-containing protein n=1 Tax=Mesorhizobium sp. 1B3 TaxID=3243599 RepID=UPI003D9733E9
MQVKKLKDADRRWLIKAGSASLVLSLTACQSVQDVGEMAADGKTGEDYLATIRSEHGLPPLHSDPMLEKAALQQAAYMAQSGRMDHTTGWGKDFATRMRANGIGGAAAENIAYGGMAPDELFTRWMNSPGHRRNMLDPRFSRFGLAYAREAKDTRRRYWALVLGR